MYSPPLEGFTSRVFSRSPSVSPNTNVSRSPSTASQRLQIGSLWNGGIRLADPAMQPQLLGPHDVAQRAMHAAVAAVEIAEVLLLGKLGERSEDRAVGPGVVLEQLEEFVHTG